MPRLLLTNVRSLIPKIDELEVAANVNEAGTICITETWLTPDIPDSALPYSSFVLFCNDHTVSVGVCILVNKKIFCERLTEFENPNIESLWLGYLENTDNADTDNMTRLTLTVTLTLTLTIIISHRIVTL